MKQSNFVPLNLALNDVLDNNKFIIPQYQRNLVWKKKKRTDFLVNVRNGEPFGSILVRLNNDRYELIDGLQRISTIKDYLKNPFEYLSEEDINETLVVNAIEKSLESSGLSKDETYINTLTPKIKKFIFSCLSENKKVSTIVNKTIKEFALSDAEEVVEAIDDVCSDFKDAIDITNLQIMAINYTGPSENIPMVFYNLNTGAVTLSKYETYAALWSSYMFKIEDEELLSIVQQKYTQLEDDSDLDVDFNEDDLRNNGISLFEYCYALSGIIRNYKMLFGKYTKSTDPVGFELLSLILGLAVNKSEKLKDLLKDASPVFLVKIKDIVKESLEFINKTLESTLISLNGNYLNSDSTYLIYHIIVSYIRENYIINIESKSITKNPNARKNKDFQRYMPLHYVCNCLSEYWQNNRQVSDLQREINSDESRSNYWYNIKLETWESVIQGFVDSQSSVGKNIPQKNKLFIDFLLKMKLEEKPQYKTYFNKKLPDDKSILDFEHIAPKKRFENAVSDLSKSKKALYPLSAVGNLCYLSVKDNRSKREKTIYENMEERPAYSNNTDYLNIINYPTEDELKFVAYNSVDFMEEYLSFIKNRHEILRKEFLYYIKQK